MASIVVCGGSVIGSAVAMMLARDGHDVTVLERDEAPPPTDPHQAWGSWDRKGVAQFHQPHNLFPRFRHIVQEALPELLPAMRDAGMFLFDPIDLMPHGMPGREPQPGDDRFWTYTGRRPVIQMVFARAAEAEPRVDVRRGVKVESLLTGTPTTDGVPHVTGVRTEEGERIEADLVVDAMGRTTSLTRMLASVGARAPVEESIDAGFTYYTRYFTGPERPAMIGPLLAPYGTISILTLPGDNDTWSVTLWCASGDTPLKAMREADVYMKVVRSLPMHAHWIDGTPVTEVLPMSGVLDRYRRFMVDGSPVATGVVAVGDAWACTNPNAGRGLSVGMIHAQGLRDVARASLDDPVRFAADFDTFTERNVTPWYRTQVEQDRARAIEMDALREGRDPPPAHDPLEDSLTRAAPFDPLAFRAILEMRMCLALPDEVYARPGFVERIERAAADREAMPVSGPTRAELLDLVG